VTGPKTYLESLRQTERSLLAGLAQERLIPRYRAELETALRAVRDKIETEAHALKVATRAAADTAIAAGERVEIFVEEHEPKAEPSE
jgi:hypothetical protein